MKAILMSIKPQYVAKILNGEKTIEIRKRFSKDYRGWVYIYCTKDNKMAWYKECLPIARVKDNSLRLDRLKDYELNGKVVARFYCYDVEEYINGHNCRYMEHNASSCLDYEQDKVCENACLTEDKLFEYCEDLHFYAINISQLEIFDKLKKLSEFGNICTNNCERCKYNNEYDICNYAYKPLTKSPQSYCWIDELE